MYLTLFSPSINWRLSKIGVHYEILISLKKTESCFEKTLNSDILIDFASTKQEVDYECHSLHKKYIVN